MLGMNWGTGSSIWTWGRTASLWGWRSPGPGCPGRLWSLVLWRYLSPAWTRSSTSCSGWPTEVPSNPELSVILWQRCTNAAKPTQSTGTPLPGLCQWLVVEVSDDEQKLCNKLDVKNMLVFSFLLEEYGFMICYSFRLTQGNNRQSQCTYTFLTFNIFY